MQCQCRELVVMIEYVHGCRKEDRGRRSHVQISDVPNAPNQARIAGNGPPSVSRIPVVDVQVSLKAFCRLYEAQVLQNCFRLVRWHPIDTQCSNLCSSPQFLKADRYFPTLFFPKDEDISFALGVADACSQNVMTLKIACL